MKNSSNTIAKKINTIHYIFCITIILLLSSTTGSFAQNFWIGGTPGAETNWNNPKNWSENRVPDWSDDMVVIPDVSSKSGFFPAVKTEVPTIAYLNLEGGAKLMIKKTGRLIIDGESTYNFGILNTGTLTNEGQIVVHNTAMEPLANPHNPVINKGGGVAFQTSDNATIWLATN